MSSAKDDEEESETSTATAAAAAATSKRKRESSTAARKRARSREYYQKNIPNSMMLPPSSTFFGLEFWICLRFCPTFREERRMIHVLCLF
jgi:hypothetical protein